MSATQMHISTARFAGTCPVCSGKIKPGKTRIAHSESPRLTVCESCYLTATAPTDGPDVQDWEREIRAKRAGQLAAAIAAAEGAPIAAAAPMARTSSPSAAERAYARAWHDPETGDDPAEREDRGDYRRGR